MDILRPVSNLQYQKFICTLIIACITFTSAAQICQGSLGDPIVNITFGSGPNPGAPLSAATTNYTYVSTDCPRDGNYAVRNRTDSCFDNLWYSVTDHTGDPNGYFMIVNASYDPGQFYLDTVKGLCAGSTYEFSSWIINLSKPVLCWGATSISVPNITFRIEKTDGTLLQSYNTNDISASDPPQWKQFGFFFTTPAGISDIVLRMVNNAPGGCGNDVGLDDITFRPCGPQINSTIVGTASSSDTLCEGTARTYTFTAQSSPGYTNPTYQWQKYISGTWTDIPGATSTSYTVNFPANAPAGDYVFRIVTAESGNIGSAKCRVSSQVLTVVINAKPPLSVTGNSPVCEGNSINLTASATSPVTWSGPNSFSAMGNSVSVSNAQQSYSGTYFASVNNGSCAWSDSVLVNVTTKPVVKVNSDSIKICQGDSIQFIASGATSYKWLPVTGLSANDTSVVTASPSSDITYMVVGSNAEGCSDTATATVKVIRKPIANAGPDKAIVKGSGIQLSAAASGDSISYYWTPDYAITGMQSLTPSVSPSTDTSYVLHVVCTAGCGSAEDTMRVIIYKQISVPNAFSPNGDGINDQWKIIGINSYPQAEVAVFDRYGRELLRRKNFQDWDGTHNGKPLEPANYYYVIDLKNGFPKLYGWVYLAR